MKQRDREKMGAIWCHSRLLCHWSRSVVLTSERGRNWARPDHKEKRGWVGGR